MKITKSYLRNLILEVFTEKETNNLLKSGQPDFNDPNLTNKIIQVFEEIVSKANRGELKKDFTPNMPVLKRGVVICNKFLQSIKKDNTDLSNKITPVLQQLFAEQLDKQMMYQMQGAGLINNDDKWYLSTLLQINKKSAGLNQAADRSLSTTKLYLK